MSRAPLLGASLGGVLAVIVVVLATELHLGALEIFAVFCALAFVVALVVVVVLVLRRPG